MHERSDQEQDHENHGRNQRRVVVVENIFGAGVRHAQSVDLGFGRRLKTFGLNDWKGHWIGLN